MCNSCVQPVQTVLKTRGHEYILCAHSTTLQPSPGHKPYLSTFCTQSFTPVFSTIHRALLYPVASMLSTLYTPPITRATNIYTYIN